jgi:DDE_Tnp_1-associated
VPVAPSSLIAVSDEGQIIDDAPMDSPQPGLLTRFRVIEDSRCANKVRHPLETILAVMTFGTAAVGGDSITAICDWAGEAPQEVLAHLGCWRDPFTGLCHPPSERTIRRVLADVNGDDLDRQTAAYLADSCERGGRQPTCGRGSGQGQARERDRILRYRGGLDGTRTGKQVAFGITSLSAGLAGPAPTSTTTPDSTGVWRTVSTTSVTSPFAKTPAKCVPGNSHM